MMTIEAISTNVIEKLRIMPHEGIQEHLCAYNSFWDEYKEQLQFHVYPNHDVYEERVKDFASDQINELRAEDISSIFITVKDTFDPLKFIPRWEITPGCYSPSASFKEKKDHIVETVLQCVQAKATLEKVEYKKPHSRFIKYLIEGNTIIAEILERINPWDYTVLSYSRTSTSLVKEETINLPNLRKYNRLSEITVDEFIRLKDSIISCQTEGDQIRISRTVSELVKILAKVKKKTPLEVIREMDYELEQRKLKSNS